MDNISSLVQKELESGKVLGICNDFGLIFRGIKLKSYSAIGHVWLVQVKDVYSGPRPNLILFSSVRTES